MVRKSSRFATLYVFVCIYAYTTILAVKGTVRYNEFFR